MSAQAHLPPLRFAPLFKEKVWGGTRLGTVLGKPAPAGVRIGESWEISGYGADQTRVDGGPLAGRRVGEVVADFGDRLTGRPAGSFPLLYKFIDANDKLSVQVHPDDVQARTHGWGGFGKTECWYIVDADPGAQTIAGFSRPVSRAEIEEAIRERALPEILNFVDLAPGDLILVPAGTVHANLPGTLLYEVQQTSDTTLRFYDWDRNDPSRPLHIAESLSVVDTTFHDRHTIPAVVTEAPAGVARRLRVACRYFAMAEYVFRADADVALSRVKSFQVLTCLHGTAEVKTSGGALSVEKGRTILLPASLHDIRVSADAQARFLLSWVPELQEEIVRPLRGQGIPDEAIEALGGNPARNDLRKAIRGSAG